MAAVRTSFPLACSSSCWSSVARGDAPTSSTAAAPSELSVAMSVVPICYRPSSLFFRAAAGEEVEGLGGFKRRSTAIQRLVGLQEGDRARRRREIRGSLHANFGIKEFGTPLPPYGAPVHGSRSPIVKPLSGGQGGEASEFWDYGSLKSLRDYTGPQRNGAPKNCGIAAYSVQSAAAKVAAVEAIEPAQGLELEVINAEPREHEPELEGGDGGHGKEGGRGGGGGGGDGSGEGEESEPHKPMSVSQKLTLAYAALVGVGGVVGFAKSGSNSSLVAGGGAALALFLVFAQLPTHPTFASFFGLGISAVLLGVMYPRFKKSGKFMPSGLVSLVSLIMTAGYVHGIVRTAH